MKFFSTQKTGLEAALFYAAAGYKVFPCHYNKNDDETKGNFSPLCHRGFKAATTDQTKIRDWWATFPDALIGISTGTTSGILALEVKKDGSSGFSVGNPCQELAG